MRKRYDTPSKDRLVKGALALLVAGVLGQIINSVPTPKFITDYHPSKPEREPNAAVLTNWTQRVNHAEVTGTGYTSTLTDLQTGQKYLINDMPAGEYWDVLISNGRVVESTRQRVKVTCEQFKNMLYPPDGVYDASDCWNVHQYDTVGE